MASSSAAAAAPPLSAAARAPAAAAPASSRLPVILLGFAFAALVLLDSAPSGLTAQWRGLNAVAAAAPARTVAPLHGGGGSSGGGAADVSAAGGGGAAAAGEGEGGADGSPMVAGVLSFNVIVTSSGRPQLGPMLESIAPQLATADYLTLLSDAAGPWAEHVAGVFSGVACNCSKVLIFNARPLGWWGHGSRNRWQRQLPGAFHMNADDDDFYAPDAMAAVRAVVTDLAPRLYIFRMVRRWDGAVGLIPPMTVTRGAQIRPGAVSTQCGVYRAVPRLLREWGYMYGGDGFFFQALVAAFGAENTTLVPRVIYHLGQGELLWPHVPALLAGDGAPPAPDVTDADRARLEDAYRQPREESGKPAWMRAQKGRA